MPRHSLRKTFLDLHCITRIITAVILSSVLVACTAAPGPTLADTPTTVPTSTPIPLPTSNRLGTYELLSPEDMRYDLDELFHRIETTHPNPYAKISKAEVELAQQNIYTELNHPLTIIDYSNKLAPLVVSLGDFHTQVQLPDSVFSESLQKEKFLPLEVGFEGPRGYITSNYTGNPDIPLGAELLTINGSVIANKKNELEIHNLRNFPFAWGLWVMDGSLTEYIIEFRRPGETTPVTLTIPSLNTAEFDRNELPSEPWELLTYKKIPNEPIGILVVNGFEGFGPLLTQAFAQIQADQIQHLIIDIRSNGGGKYDDVDSLMDFLTNQSYQHCARSYEAPFNGYGSGAPREVACEVIQPFNAAERFKGQLYLLIGPDTNSAAITFATILQDYHLASLIGTATNDVASYCANIVLEGTPLPRTKLMYTLSKTCYIRPSGVLDDQPVIPDFSVTTSIADRLAGKDPVLEYTLNMIRTANPTP